MELFEVMEYLKSKGNDATKKIYISHGAKEPLFGVKTGDLKEIVRKVNKDHELALELYGSGNSDAMYLAGQIADASRMDMETLDIWVGKAYWNMLSERCVSLVAAKSPFGLEAARKWIVSDDEMTACAGYGTLSTMFSFMPDDAFDLDEIRRIVDDAAGRIQNEGVHLQNAMKNFLILTGLYIAPLYDYVLTASENIGRIKPAIPENNCNIQTVTDYLVRYRDRVGKKNKSMKK
ncbi:DNA alkylation repair protein [Youngiibacter fragilis]|uniref:DNA alkylation repair enzyme n=1 Tax=Youngiibacter fragilis 232.1 TaxID=994573 RepID=V7I9L4_9CLOT|nr:DNA alkylation repair protein [Youngiibacter fragilis]ETA82543.1 DNA alkylation repair enzyme [Youngiibacter fragilis 232.1]